MCKNIAEASEFRHILPDAVSGGGEGSMNHEQAMLMKSSRVSDLNTPWEQVLHLASRRVFPKCSCTCRIFTAGIEITG